MSEHSRKALVSSESTADRRAAFKQRLPYYAGAAAVAVLAIAWFDGGEEAIRPIVQPVELAPVGESGE